MTKQMQLTSRAWGELLLLGLIWGGVFLAVAVALDEIPPFTLVAFRTSLAAPLLWAYVIIRKLPVPKGFTAWWALFVMGLLNNAIPFTLLNYGQTLIDSGLASIFNAGTAIFGILIAAIFLRDERLTTKKLLGVTVGLTGIMITVGVDSVRNFDLNSLAQIACILATVSYALAGVWARKFLRSIRPAAVSAGMVTCSSLVIIPLALIIDGAPQFGYSSQTILAVIYSATIATALAYLLYFRILAMAGSANTLLVTLVVPPVAIFLGFLVLGESLPLRSWLGFGFIALGLSVIDGRLWKHLRRVFST